MENLDNSATELEDKARFIINEGDFVSRSDFRHLEISLYRLYGESIEIWFETKKEQVLKINYMRGHEFDPYLKHLKTIGVN